MDKILRTESHIWTRESWKSWPEQQVEWGSYWSIDTTVFHKIKA